MERLYRRKDVLVGVTLERNANLVDLAEGRKELLRGAFHHVPDAANAFLELTRRVRDR
jgi:hypothetical protein